MWLTKKVLLEEQFKAWVEASEERTDKYGEVLSTLENSYTMMADKIEPLLYTSFAGLNGSEIVGYAINFNGLYELLKPIDKKELPKDKDMAKKMKEERQEQIKAAAESLLEEVDEHFKKTIMRQLINNYWLPCSANTTSMFL